MPCVSLMDGNTWLLLQSKLLMIAKKLRKASDFLVWSYLAIAIHHANSMHGTYQLSTVCISIETGH